MNQITESDFEKDYSKQLLSRARRGDIRHGARCDLAPDDLRALWSRCRGCCEITGRPFTKDACEGCLVRHPFAPSLDRIDCKLGHTKSNTRLVCVAVNFAMNQWGEDVYLELAEAAVKHGKAAELDRISHEWFGNRENAIQAAEVQLAGLDGPNRARMQRHIAALRAWKTRNSQISRRSKPGHDESVPGKPR